MTVAITAAALTILTTEWTVDREHGPETHMGHDRSSLRRSPSDCGNRVCSPSKEHWIAATRAGLCT